jgi:hypothetical protein
MNPATSVLLLALWSRSNDFISTMRRQRLVVASTPCIALRPWGDSGRRLLRAGQIISFEVEYASQCKCS